MAKFSEVMRQWQRMCKSMQKKNMSCKEDCLLGHNPTCGELEYASLEEINNAETVIMKWAAEHPVVYPTWGEYITMLMLDDITHRNDSTPQTLGQWMNKKPIRADIAEKLGIEPKGDV